MSSLVSEDCRYDKLKGATIKVVRGSLYRARHIGDNRNRKREKI